jgi:cellulose biosynthesis protein BcsQ
MNHIQLIVADENLEFIEMITHFINTSDCAFRYVLKTFTQREKLTQYLLFDEVHPIVLINRSMLDTDKLPLSQVQCLILLTDFMPKATESNYPEIYKYQPLDQLFSKVMSIYQEQTGMIMHLDKRSRHTKVISVYSASGGSGKSTISLNLAKQYSSYGQKVIYISLETLCAFPALFHTDDTQQFSQMLYFLRSNSDKLQSKLTSLISSHIEFQFDYIEPIRNMKELDEITFDDVCMLINIISTTEKYDVMLFDLESSLHPRIEAALKCSDHICWIVLDDLTSFSKARTLIDNLQFLEADFAKTTQKQIHFIINKYLGNAANNFHLDFAISGHLPYIPQWKIVTTGEQLLSSAVFNQHLTVLASTLLKTPKRGEIN